MPAYCYYSTTLRRALPKKGAGKTRSLFMVRAASDGHREMVTEVLKSTVRKDNLLWHQNTFFLSFLFLRKRLNFMSYLRLKRGGKCEMLRL